MELAIASFFVAFLLHSFERSLSRELLGLCVLILLARCLEFITSSSLRFLQSILCVSRGKENVDRRRDRLFFQLKSSHYAESTRRRRCHRKSLFTSIFTSPGTHWHRPTEKQFITANVSLIHKQPQSLNFNG